MMCGFPWMAIFTLVFGERIKDVNSIIIDHQLYSLVICYIAMENGPFIDGLPI